MEHWYHRPAQRAQLQPSTADVDPMAAIEPIPNLTQPLPEAAEDQPHSGADKPIPAAMWLSHHWEQDHAERCVQVAGHPVCRRCLALYPLGLLVAVLSAAGYPPWPVEWDPAPIWILSIPATVTFIGEVLGLIAYSARWQVVTTLVAAIAYGRALGYEFVERWSPEFWEPIAVFGGLWFFAAYFGFRSNR